MEEKSSTDLLNIFKQRMRIFHNAEDDNLEYILKSSIAYITDYCNKKDLEDEAIRELVIERSRYVYNDQVEFFYQNYKHMLDKNSLGNYGGDVNE